MKSPTGRKIFFERTGSAHLCPVEPTTEMSPLIARTIPLIISLFYRMATWAGFLTLLGCSTTIRKTVHSQVVSGPLEIHCSVERTASGAWYNLGGKPGGEDVTAYFSVNHLGKPVSVNTPAGATTQFWQALFLKDAPKPAVLVATHSVYLIAEENRSAGASQVTVKPIDVQEGDFAKYQWLDSENGQPGKQQQVYLGDDSKSSRFLSGGRYLLINTRTVLDVQSFATYPIDNNSSALVQQLNGFNAFQSEVVGFSPKKTQLVLIGYRRNPSTNTSEYALVAIDILKNRPYAVPFDRTATQFFSIWDATPTWFATYFDWTADQNGTEKLRLHSFKQLPYWQGRWHRSPGADQPERYEIRPVLPGIVSPFMACIGQHYHLSDLKTRETEDQIITEFMLNGTQQTLYVNKRDKTLTWECPDNRLVRTVGEAFDKELAAGKFQDCFGQFDHD